MCDRWRVRVRKKSWVEIRKYGGWKVMARSTETCDPHIKDNGGRCSPMKTGLNI